MTSEKGGRPPIIETPEDFERLASAYFAQCVENGTRPTVNGLTLALGYAHRQSLFDLSSRAGFSDAVKRARTQLESAWESALAGTNVTGAIFWLKNQGWKDTQDINHGGAVTINEVLLVGGNGHGEG